MLFNAARHGHTFERDSLIFERVIFPDAAIAPVSFERQPEQEYPDEGGPWYSFDLFGFAPAAAIHLYGC